MRGIRVGKEGGDDAGFGDDFAIEVDGGDEAALGGMLVDVWRVGEMGVG